MTTLNYKIAIIGLGYVGLPLFLEFSKKYNVVGYDVNKKRISELLKSKDTNNEFKLAKLKNKNKFIFTNNHRELNECDIYIITVPTPVLKNKLPDFKFLKTASKLIGSKLSQHNIVIYESTVYPGAIEEICLPILEKNTLLKFNKDFFLGYSPERINPGDKKHTLVNIKKITSGSNKKTASIVDKLYGSIIKAGTHKVSSIKIAEAAKVIENCQRDINIAFANELSMIFNMMNLNSREIFDAAATKWNFLNFRPGLVGGHCISVDPYYLSYISKLNGHNPKVILSGRETNDNVPKYIVKNILKKIKIKKIKSLKSNALILGLSFKENCNDVRNSKVFEIYNQLKDKFNIVDIYDPLVNTKNIQKTHNLRINKKLILNYYDVIVVAVAHDYFKDLGIDNIIKYRKNNGIVFDLKNLFIDKTHIDWSM